MLSTMTSASTTTSPDTWRDVCRAVTGTVATAAAGSARPLHPEPRARVIMAAAPCAPACTKLYAILDCTFWRHDASCRSSVNTAHEIAAG